MFGNQYVLTPSEEYIYVDVILKSKFKRILPVGFKVWLENYKLDKIDNVIPNDFTFKLESRKPYNIFEKMNEKNIMNLIKKSNGAFNISSTRIFNLLSHVIMMHEKILKKQYSKSSNKIIKHLQKFEHLLDKRNTYEEIKKDFQKLNEIADLLNQDEYSEYINRNISSL